MNSVKAIRNWHFSSSVLKRLIAFSQKPDYLYIIDGFGPDALLLKPVTFEVLQKTLARLGIHSIHTDS
jgi:hypothetical protein